VVAALPTPNNPGKASRDTTVAASRYRADLKVSTAYAGTSADDWAMELYRIELNAKKMDRFEARTALSTASGARATDNQLTLAGLLLEQGRLTEKNRQRATALYERAALRAYVPAQTLLGELQYERQNYAEAYKWLSEAAQSGYGRPKADLAQLMFFGQGTTQDPAQAARMLMESFKGMMQPNLSVQPGNR
jgi:TPR repeat protein